MTNRLPIAACVAALLLTACGNKADLLMPNEVPPEDARRFIIKSSVPTQEERDAAAEAAEAAEDARYEAEDAANATDEADATDDAGDAAPLPPVPVIQDVPVPRTP